jgi:hypothetical protein
MPMRSIETADAQTLCLKLLEAETEEEVVQILRAEGFWNDRSVWKPYGDIPNNRGIVGNQQSSPVAALVEKIVNSIDAILIFECLKLGIDPTSSSAPTTMSEASETLLKVRGGKIHNLDARKERPQLAERIVVVTTGTKDHPCYTIIDDGEGQSPDNFQNTFLSLLRENKSRIAFVQGKFNMGGTGVLQFSGMNSFQLIISRRQPEIASSKPSALANFWGFTLIRRLEPAADQPQSTYVYLAPNGKIPFFQADSIRARPGRYLVAHEQPLYAGTCIKLWNYKFPGRLKTIATLDLRYALERYLQEPALPIRICERRTGYRAHYYDTTISGLVSVLSDNFENIEPGFDTGSPLSVPDVGRVELRLLVIKEDVGEKRYPFGVFFNVNGQLHGELGSDLYPVGLSSIILPIAQSS